MLERNDSDYPDKIIQILNNGLEVQMAKIDDFRAVSVEAGAELKRLDDAIEQAKLDIGVALLKEKTVDKSKLNELEEMRADVGMRLSALAKQIGDAQAELREAQAAEYKAKAAEYEAESENQLEQIVKTIYELNTLSLKWMQLAREYDRLLRNQFGRGGIGSDNLPVLDIYNSTENWLRNWGNSNRFAALLERAGVPSYRERAKAAKEQKVKSENNT